MFKRLLIDIVYKKFFKGKVIIITGARQTGKTTLVLELISHYGFINKDIKIFNCDNPTDREMLSAKDVEFLKKLIGRTRLIFIDEGQKVENLGQTLKLLIDHYKDSNQIIVTGSSGINLLYSTQEALTGRKIVYDLYPMSLGELFPDKNRLKILKELEILLIYGSYPEVITSETLDDKRELLQELCSSYLYKDIFEFQQVKNSSILNNLLKALALQTGNEVSYNELSGLIGIDKKTVERYIDLLEKNFVIFRLPPYTKNKRREISKLRKIYFYDLGIRNTIINNFNFLDSRNDVGALWENFLIVERLKYCSYQRIFSNQYFWRTYDGSEVDFVEDRDGRLFGFEFKWGEKFRQPNAPVKWLEYPQSSYQVVTKKNFIDFINLT